MKTKQTHLQTVIGIDLGDKKHAICVLCKDGTTLKEFTIANRSKELEELCKSYPKARVALEVGTHSPWVSRLLAAGGMEVFVANARKVRAIYQNERKCDQLDAQMLAKLVRVDHTLLSPVRHVSEHHQRDLLPIKLRDTLVRQRAAIVSSIRTTLKSLGLPLTCTSSATFAKHARRQLEEKDSALLAIIEPSLAALEALCTSINAFEKVTLKAVQERHPQAQKLQQIAGVGPITSLSFVLTVEDPNRFADARDIGAYLGLVPRRDQSGATDKQLPISKTGNRYLRCLLVQCAQYLLGHFGVTYHAFIVLFGTLRPDFHRIETVKAREENLQSFWPCLENPGVWGNAPGAITTLISYSFCHELGLKRRDAPLVAATVVVFVSLVLTEVNKVWNLRLLPLFSNCQSRRRIKSRRFSITNFGRLRQKWTKIPNFMTSIW